MTMKKLAAIQMCSGVDPAKNAERMRDLVRQANALGAHYVQTPEMTGAVQKDRKGLHAVITDEKSDIVVRTGAELAKELKIHMHVGSTPIALGDGRIANRGFLFGPDGQLICRYDKIHMFDVDLDNGESWRESAVYRPGESTIVADLEFGKMGFAICYDVRFPQLFRAQAMAGTEIFTLPTAFTRQTGLAHWDILVRARAIENGAFLIAAAQAGLHEDGRETYGHSIIVDPWGRVLAEAGDSGEAVITADIDLAAVSEARKKIPNLKNAREFTVEIVGQAAHGGQAA